MDLHLPADARPGAIITLTADQPWVRVWGNRNGTGAPIISAWVPIAIWTVGQNIPPGDLRVWVGAVAGSSGMATFTLTDSDISADNPGITKNLVSATAEAVPPIYSLFFVETKPNINRDNGTGMYDGEQWVDGNLNGTIDGQANLAGTIDAPNEHDYPLSFIRSLPGAPDTLTVIATFGGIIPAGITVAGVTDYGVNGSPMDFEATQQDIENGRTVIAFDATTPLASTISGENLSINWLFSSGADAVQRGQTTTNRLYVTGAPADGAYETELYLACNFASGLSPHNPNELNPGAAAADMSVVNAIWANFWSLQTVEGTTLTYESNFNNAPDKAVPSFLGMPSLLGSGDGDAEAWSAFLSDIFQIVGVTGIQDMKLIENPGVIPVGPNADPAGFIIGNWNFSATAPGPVFDNQYKLAEGYINAAGNGFNWFGQTEFTKGQGPAAQGNPSPLGLVVGRHEVVKITFPDGTVVYFDPSYRLAFPSVASFATTMLRGFWRTRDDPVDNTLGDMDILAVSGPNLLVDQPIRYIPFQS